MSGSHEIDSPLGDFSQAIDSGNLINRQGQQLGQIIGVKNLANGSKDPADDYDRQRHVWLKEHKEISGKVFVKKSTDQ